jgi:hypothetical protein
MTTWGSSPRHHLLRWLPALLSLLSLFSLVAACTRTGFEATVDTGPAAADHRAADSVVDRDSGSKDLEVSPPVDAAPDITPDAGAQVVGVTGAVQLQIAPPSVLPQALESDTLIRLFRERHGVTLAADLVVNITATGQHSKYSGLPSLKIPKGTVVTSYTIHIDPVGRPAGVEYSGGFSLNAPVLGLIVVDQDLIGSDADLGAPGTQYPSGTSSRGPDDGEDQIHLSADRRSLLLSVTTDKNVDQLRVIVGQ